MKNHEVGGGQNYDSGWEDLARERLNERLERRSRESLQQNLEQDRPDGPWQKIVKKISNPNVLGSVAAIGFATMMVADVVLNGPSEFVVNSPEAATTALALGAAAIGAAFNKLGRKAEAADLKTERQAERDARKGEK